MFPSAFFLFNLSFTWWSEGGPFSYQLCVLFLTHLAPIPVLISTSVASLFPRDPPPNPACLLPSSWLTPVCTHMHALRLWCSHDCAQPQGSTSRMVPEINGPWPCRQEGRDILASTWEQQLGIDFELKCLYQEPKATQMWSSPWNSAGGSMRCRFWRLLH